MRVLLIEDDPMIGREVQEALKESAYAVDWIDNGKSAKQFINDDVYDIVILDIGLPVIDGIVILKYLRSKGNNLPVLIISARDNINDKLVGLDEGADDYLIKPFVMEELLARLRAVIRRRNGQSDCILKCGNFSLNIATKEATIDGEVLIRLTQREYSLLYALMLRPGAILSRSELEEKIYSWGEEVESNAVEFIIHSLRKKMGQEAIKNIRGLGWMVSKER